MLKHTHEEGREEEKIEAELEAVQADGNAGQAPPSSEDGQEKGQPASVEPVQIDLNEKIALLETQLIEANDLFLRKAADFENYRKRMVREKQEAVDYANQALLLDLIEIIDDFERALKAAGTYFPAETSQDGAGEGQAGAPSDQASLSVFKTFYEGVSMIEKRFSSILENKWGLKRFDSLGQPFDPNRHEAIMMDKSSEISEPVVQEEFYKGYTLKDRVVRSAKVKVLMPVHADNAECAATEKNI
jgi:molecular chaperone GrpE